MAFVSLSLYLSRSETTCSEIGLVEKYPKQHQPEIRIYRAKKPKLVCVFVWRLSLLVSISLNLRRLALRLGWLKKEEEEAEEISNMGMACYLRIFLVCVCIVLLLLSLSISDFFSLSKLESLFLSLLIHGFDFSWVRLMGLIFHEFDS